MSDEECQRCGAYGFGCYECTPEYKGAVMTGPLEDIHGMIAGESPMSDYRIEAASKEEWAERALRAEAENARLREAMTCAMDSLRQSPDQNTETIRTMTHLFLALETKGK